MSIEISTAQRLKSAEYRREPASVWGMLGYLGQLGVWGAIEGGYSVHIGLLAGQESEGTSHAESHAPNLQGTRDLHRKCTRFTLCARPLGLPAETGLSSSQGTHLYSIPR